jgi:hypothetical protein
MNFFNQADSARARFRGGLRGVPNENIVEDFENKNKNFLFNILAAALKLRPGGVSSTNCFIFSELRKGF